MLITIWRTKHFKWQNSCWHHGEIASRGAVSRCWQLFWVTLPLSSARACHAYLGQASWSKALGCVGGFFLFTQSSVFKAAFSKRVEIALADGAQVHFCQWLVIRWGDVGEIWQYQLRRDVVAGILEMLPQYVCSEKTSILTLQCSFSLVLLHLFFYDPRACDTV